MGTLQFTEFKDDLRYAIGNRSDLDRTVNSTISNRLGRWVNRALRWTALPQVFRHPEMKVRDTITLADGTTRNTGPTDIYAIRFLINETQDFKYRPSKDLDFLDRGSTNRVYGREGNVILIEGDSQNNGDTVRIYYWKYHADITADGGTTELADYFDDVVLGRAIAIGAAATGQLEMADWWNAHVAELINDHVDPEKFDVEDEGWENPRESFAPVMGRR